MQRLEVSGAVRPLYGTLGVRGLIYVYMIWEIRVGCMRVFARVVRNISQQALLGDLVGDSCTLVFFSCASAAEDVLIR